MDAFTLLKQDHEQVAQLLEQLEATDVATQRQQIFQQIKTALDIHAHIEETIFYPRLKQEAETREITLEAYDEHQEIKDTLTQLAGTPADGADWSDLVADLKDIVEHHVDEEENEMFPQAREVLGAQAINDLGTQLAAEKQRQQQQRAASA